MMYVMVRVKDNQLMTTFDATDSIEANMHIRQWEKAGVTIGSMKAMTWSEYSEIQTKK